MNQVEKAARFSELHVKGAPLLLYNAWDAGTAKSILDAGAKAIATSSWAVGGARLQGRRIHSDHIRRADHCAHRKHGSMHLCPSTSKGATATTMVRWPKMRPASLNSASSGSISKTASFRAPGSIQSTSTPGGSQPFVKLRERRASTSLLMRGQICFWVNNATQQTLLTTLLTARKPMPPREPPDSSFRACGTMH